MVSICCFSKPKQPEWLAPIAMNQPVPFTAPPRPGFKVAPEPPAGRGPSIIYNNFVKEDMPVGFHVSDLSGVYPE
uniref:Secretory carrier membrane protein n=1 Tax=Caenorhabditis tropicalis TaxID=1561998 RepID=A0A1I7TQS5_9PELO